MIRCCFAGHRSAPGSLFKEVVSVIENIVLESDIIEFYSGGMGDFDNLCEQAVRETKKRFPEKGIRLNLVLPSYSYAYARSKEYPSYMKCLFDDILVCGASDGAHYKSMITKRNRWIAEKSDIMIAYVMHSGGGAYASLKYAEKQKLKIIRVGINR